MSQSATARSVRRAVRVIKRMDYMGEGWEDCREATRRFLGRVLEQRMRERVSRSLEVAAAEGIADRRNGTYSRHLLTSLGDVELSVPRTRRFNPVGLLQAYARREQRVDRLILRGFVLGLSTRKVGETLLELLGERVSPSTVSRVARSLDAAVAAFHRRPLKDRYRVLVLDGVVLSRKTGAGAVRRPVLVALGIRPDGKREIIDFRFALSEGQPEWESFLTDLYRRGLAGQRLELIAIDGGKGLRNAVEIVFSQVPVQRCWAHKTRNITEKMRVADREAAKRGLRRISHAPDRRSARHAARLFADRWSKLYPRAVVCLRDDLEELLSFFNFDDPDWRLSTRTTNAIERRFKEVRRRTRPMGVFSDRTSMDRILFAVFTYENQKEGSGIPFLLTQNS